MLIEPDTQSMHQDRPQDPVAQMPQIACPHAFELAAIRQLAEDRVNAIAHLPKHSTLVRRGLRRMGVAVWGLQDNPVLAQTRLNGWDPRGAIAQGQPLRPFQHHGSHFSIRFIGWSQERMRDDSRPAQPHMQAKTVKRLAVRMIFAIAGLAAKAHAPGGAQNGRRAVACCR